jgi:uncharacterized protein
MLDKAIQTTAPPAPQTPANDVPLIQCEKPGPWLQLLTIKTFEWNHVQLPIAGLPPALEGLRILHLSDFHARAYWEPAYDELIQRVQKDPPDLILFTGDFVDSKYDPRRELEIAGRLVDNLRARLGFIAILGNHDGDLVAPIIATHNLTLLDNHRLCLTSGSATIELIGLAGVDRKDIDLPALQALGPKSPDAVRIILSHYPGSIRSVAFLKPDLFLCGHSHGGQVCLPGGLPIARHDSLPRRLCTGIHRELDTWHVANRGLGYSGKGLIRLFCPAEVIDIKLRRA